MVMVERGAPEHEMQFGRFCYIGKSTQSQAKSEFSERDNKGVAEVTLAGCSITDSPAITEQGLLPAGPGLLSLCIPDW